MHRTKDNFNYLTTAPVPKVIMTLAAPTIVSMLVTSFYNIADTYFVGKINTQSTAAVGIVFSVMSIIQAVGFFFGHGSGNYISDLFGSKSRRRFTDKPFSVKLKCIWSFNRRGFWCSFTERSH